MTIRTSFQHLWPYSYIKIISVYELLACGVQDSTSFAGYEQSVDEYLNGAGGKKGGTKKVGAAFSSQIDYFSK